MIRYIFCDMDGTLLTDDNRLPEGFDAMMAELRRRGVTFCPASGRQYFSLLDTFPAYKDSFIFFAENGTNVIRQGEEIYSDCIGEEIARTILNDVYAKRPETFCVFCGKKDAYALSAQNDAANRAELHKYYTHATYLDTDRFEPIDDQPVKISLYDSTGHSAETVYPLVKKYADVPLHVVLSSDYWVDIMSPTANKGAAIQAFQKQYGVSPDECAAFGDYLNDTEMLGAVTYSFAMANAHPEIQKLAKYQTASNNEQGVLKGIQRLIDAGLC